MSFSIDILDFQLEPLIIIINYKGRSDVSVNSTPANANRVYKQSSCLKRFSHSSKGRLCSDSRVASRAAAGRRMRRRTRARRPRGELAEKATHQLTFVCVSKREKHSNGQSVPNALWRKQQTIHSNTSNNVWSSKTRHLMWIKVHNQNQTTIYYSFVCKCWRTMD